MLVLDRKSGESVLIFPDDQINPEMTVKELFSQGPISISVKYKDTGTVKLAIKAPGAIKILREELGLHTS
ncbi:MAG TPA: carbon storage regulator [Gammaproteobacteria bacterium]|nr:carbon storage regulator [Gammaproteobacteria bacterium]